MNKKFYQIVLLRPLVVALVVASSLARPPLASAQEERGASAKAAAEALFDSGLELMKAGKTEEACPKLEESERIDPATGTLLYLAECYELLGRTASAWATFREAASRARAEGQLDRADVARERAQRLEGKLSLLSLTVAEGNRSIPGFELRRGSLSVQPGLWGVPVPVDPGEHQVVAEAPGHQPFRRVVAVAAEAGAVAVSVPRLSAIEDLPATSSPRSAGVIAPPVPTAERPDNARARRTQRTTGMVLASVGIAALLTGIGSGVYALTRNNAARDYCDARTCSSERGVTLTNQARAGARLANGLLAAGGAITAGGVVLLATAPRERPGPRSESQFLRYGATSPGLGGRF